MCDTLGTFNALQNLAIHVLEEFEEQKIFVKVTFLRQTKNKQRPADQLKFLWFTVHIF